MPTVKNKKYSTIDPYKDIYIMRPGPWGNPFIIGLHGTRTEVIDKFEVWLITGENFGIIEASENARQQILQNLRRLKGKNLICCCKPMACHGDILLKMAENLK